jgi:Glycosyl transferases group 1
MKRDVVETSHRRTVSALVVTCGTTRGLRHAEQDLVAGLSRLDLRIGVSVPAYSSSRILRAAHPLLDLAEAWSISRAVASATKDTLPSVIIYPTSLSTIFEPKVRLRTAIVRYDALASENRRGARNLPLRLLERRSLSRAKALAPWSLRRTEGATSSRLPPKISFPPTVDAYETKESRRQMMVCYGSNPHKKGLDIVVEAWGRACLPVPWKLHIGGISARAGRSWLSRRKVTEPAGIVWAGELEAKSYRGLTSAAAAVIAGSRFEDFGIAQLEALADGAVLVTVPSAGPYEALSIARGLDPHTVAANLSPEDLADAIRYAASMSASALLTYQRRASAEVAQYSSKWHQDRIEKGLVPLFLGSES